MFDANGTEGLELFTWVVGFIIAIAGALVLTHARSVSKEDHGLEGVEEADEQPIEKPSTEKHA